jgi:hypothetical protein
MNIIQETKPEVNTGKPNTGKPNTGYLCTPEPWHIAIGYIPCSNYNLFQTPNNSTNLKGENK